MAPVRAVAAAAFGKTFAPDGEMDDVQPAAAPRESVADLGLDPPVAVEMAAGDAFLIDLRSFHFGSANTSKRTRAQLSATFREPVAPGEEATDDGFTCELRDELKGQWRLGDFLGDKIHNPPRQC